MTIARRSSLVAVLCLAISASAFGQSSNAAYYGQAASAYESNAAQCSNPAGAMCMRQFGTYYRCMANGGSCGAPPSCSVACGGSGGANVGLGGAIAPFSSMSSPAAARAQAMGQLFGLGLSMLMSQDSDSASSAEEDAARAAAAQAAKDRQRQQDAANLLQESNQIYSQLNSRPAAPGAASPTTVVSSLLDDPAPTQDGTAAVVELLGDDGATPAGSSDTTGSVTALLSNSSSPPPANETPPSSAAEPSTGTAASSLPAGLAPQDPAINAVLQESEDVPTPAPTQLLPQMLQSDSAQTTDGLGGLILSRPVLAGDLASDPVVQWVAANQGNLLAVPAPAAGDSPDAAADKVFGQATAGFGDLLRGMAGGPFAFSKALYGYGTKMVNQLGAELGMANATVFGSQQASSDP